MSRCLVSSWCPTSLLFWCPTFSFMSRPTSHVLVSGVPPSVPLLLSWCPVLVSHLLMSRPTSHVPVSGVLLVSHFSCSGVPVSCPGVPLLMFLLVSCFSCPGVQRSSIQCPASRVLVSHFSCPGIPHLISQCPTFLWFLHNVFDDFWVIVLLALVYSESLNLLMLY
ncbi:hypothetical protein J3A83DRAFT_4257328 [Scleroderma citrinum]